MNFATLEIIHELLKKQFQKAEKQDQAASADLKRAYEALEKAESENPDGSAVIEAAKVDAEAAKGKRDKTRKALDEIRSALADFEDHEWC